MTKQIKELSRGEKAAATRKANQLKQAKAEAKQLKAARLAREAEDKAKLDAQHKAKVEDEILHAEIEALAADLPSWRRVLVGFVLGIGAAFAVGYGIGMLLAYCLAGIMTLTASVAMQFVLSVIAWAIGLYASWKVGGYVGGKVFASVVLPDGLVGKSYDSVANACGEARDKVKGWFTSKPAVAQFTGAHPAGA